MYASAMDHVTGIVVSILSPTPHFNEDADYTRLLEDIQKQQQKQPPAEGFVLVLLTLANYPSPNAVWRKRFADARGKLLHPVHFYLVSPSPVIRGVITAVSWVAPPKVGSSTAYGSFSEAVVAIEERFHRKLPALPKLYDEANQRIR